MPPQPGQALHQHRLNQTVFGGFGYLLQAIAVKAHTADIVIEGFSKDFVCIFKCIEGSRQLIAVPVVQLVYSAQVDRRPRPSLEPDTKRISPLRNL